MSLQPRSPDQAIAAKSWIINCPDCAQKMTMTATGLTAPRRETRAYACVCGHRERITVTLRRRNAKPGPRNSSTDDAD
jgi:hypothetical protein